MADGGKSKTSASEGPTRHYHGHRERLRQRVLEGDGGHFKDYELLELMLYAFIPRVDTKPIAKELLARFGTVSGVLAAPPERLMEVKGVGETAASYMEDRGGRCELLLPYATLEPIRKMLLQNFMGEKFGRDNIWEGHLATELWSAPTALRVVLDEFQAPLGKMMNLQVGDTLIMNATPDSKAQLMCGDIHLTHGQVGRIGQNVAMRVEAPITHAAKKRVMEAR